MTQEATPPPVSSDPLREALTELVACKDLKDGLPSRGTWEAIDKMAQADEYARRQPLAWERARATLTTIPPATEPDYWPSAKVVVHEDEVRHGVCRVTATLYAPGLPPGEYDLYLSSRATEPDRNAALTDFYVKRLAELRATNRCAYDSELHEIAGRETLAKLRAAIATRTATKD